MSNYTEDARRKFNKDDLIDKRRRDNKFGYEKIVANIYSGITL